MGYYTVKQIYPWLYSIADPGNVFCYLIVGGERALLYDTAYGIGDLPAAIREVTDKPVTVVLGHGHTDHTNGAYQFGEAWLHAADVELCEAHNTEEFRKNIISDNDALPEGFDAEAYVTAGTGKIKILTPGQVFELGGLTAEVIEMEGHTAGSVGLLIREHRVLLTSDASNPHIWMFLNEALSVHAYIAMLKRVAALPFDTFFVGHSDAPMPKSDFNKFIAAAENASVEKAKPYESYIPIKAYIYEEDGAAIVFSEEKLKSL